MASNMSPEERKRISEEEKIRMKTQVNTGCKWVGISMIVSILVLVLTVVIAYLVMSSSF